MFQLPHGLSLKHLASCLHPRRLPGGQFAVLGSRRPLKKRSPAAHPAFLPLPCRNQLETAWLWLQNGPPPAAQAAPLLGVPTCAATTVSILILSLSPACHLFCVLISQGCRSLHKVLGSPLSFPGGSVAKNPPANAGDAGDISSIFGLGRSPGGGNDDPLQHSCLENPVDRGVCGLQSMGSQRVGQDSY